MKILNMFKRKQKQRTFCYCPNCKNELISSNSFDKEGKYYTYFKCSKCGNKSKWDFNCPVPILIENKNK